MICENTKSWKIEEDFVFREYLCFLIISLTFVYLGVSGYIEKIRRIKWKNGNQKFG